MGLSDPLTVVSFIWLLPCSSPFFFEVFFFFNLKGWRLYMLLIKFYYNGCTNVNLDFQG